MEKVIKVLPLGLLTAAFVKTLVFADAWSVAALGILAILHAAIEYKASAKQLDKVEASLATLSAKIVEMDKSVNEAKSHAAAIKLSQQKVSPLRF